MGKPRVGPSFLDEEDVEVAPEPEAPVAEAPGETTVEPEPEAQPAPEESQPEPEPQPQPEPEPQPQNVPLAALLAERDRGRQFEERSTALEQEVRRLQAQLQPQPAVPDPYDDPEGYVAWQSQQQAQALHQTTLNLKLNMSEELARQGPDGALVDEALQWMTSRARQSPAFTQEVFSHRHPYGYVIEQYKRDKLLSSLDPAELDSFRQWKAAQTAAAPAANPTSAPKPPPRSLASAPSAGGIATQVEPEPFEALFSKG